MKRPALLSASLWWAGLALGLWCAAAIPQGFHGFAAAPAPRPGWAPICLNNLVVVGLAVLGRFAWGLPTVLVLLNSGVALGLVSGAVNLPWLEVLRLTLPHCLFEVPGLWVAGAVGLSRGSSIRVGRLVLVSVLLTVAGAFVEGEFTLEQESSRVACRSVLAGRGGGRHVRLDMGHSASGWSRHPW